MSTNRTHEAAWRVLGRGQSKVYTACLPAQQAQPGETVRLESKAGVVTTGTLVEVHKADDGLEFWTFEKHSKSAEQHAADRALRMEHQAEYWASDKGTETARKIAERAAKKAASKASETSETSSKAQQVSEQAPVEQASENSERATKLAELLAAGIDAATAKQAIDALFPMEQASETKQASKQAKRNQNGSKASKQASKASSDHGDCGACKRTDQPLTQHPAGVDVCNYCKSADVETITRRAARKASK